jgi:hypothetical protein
MIREFQRHELENEGLHLPWRELRVNVAGRRKKSPLAGIPDEAAEAAAKPRAAAKPQARNFSSVAASPRPLKPEKGAGAGASPPLHPPPRKELPRFARKPRLRRREGLRPFPAPCPVPRQAVASGLPGAPPGRPYCGARPIW